jgi:hypothetical protein
MIFKELALLDKTDITAKTPFGEVTLVIARTDVGYSCGLWSRDKLLGSNKIGKSASVVGKATVIGALLIQAKEHLAATHDRYPEGLDIVVRVEHKGKVHEVPGRIPLAATQIAQLTHLLDWVRKVNAELHKRG